MIIAQCCGHLKLGLLDSNAFCFRGLAMKSFLFVLLTGASLFAAGLSTSGDDRQGGGQGPVFGHDLDTNALRSLRTKDSAEWVAKVPDSIRVKIEATRAIWNAKRESLTALPPKDAGRSLDSLRKVADVKRDSVVAKLPKDGEKVKSRLTDLEANRAAIEAKIEARRAAIEKRIAEKKNPATKP